MSKRERSESESPEETTTAKQRKAGDLDTGQEDAMKELRLVQGNLMQLDQECAYEQLKIQMLYDEKKSPLFHQRQTLIEKIPGFWCKVLTHHPTLVYADTDLPLLQMLTTIELEDNLDDGGSYRVRMRFSKEALEYISPNVLEKTVQYIDGAEHVKVAPVVWQEGKNLPAMARAASVGDDHGMLSIFEWFTESADYGGGDLGEAIRRDLWHTPLQYFEEYDDPTPGEDEDRDSTEGGDGDVADDDDAPEETSK